MGGFFKDLPRTWTMTTHVTSFLKATIGYFKRCFDWLKSTEPTVAGVENMFRDENYIPNFVKEAQLMLNSLNSEAVTTQVGLRSRFLVLCSPGIPHSECGNCQRIETPSGVDEIGQLRDTVFEGESCSVDGMPGSL